MLLLYFHTEAEAEVDAAFDWYRQRSLIAARGFLEELNAVLNRILQNPDLFPRTAQTLRKAILHRYPYYLLFREHEESIQILVVAHAKRLPGYWKTRS